MRAYASQLPHCAAFWLPMLAPDAVLRTLALKFIRKLEASMAKAATATLPIVTRTLVGRSTTEATVTPNARQLAPNHKSLAGSDKTA